MIPVLTKEQAYKLDKDTIESGHLSQEELMDNAGKAVAQFFCENIKDAFNKKVVVVCGNGNNGGDGLIAHSYLKKYNVSSEIVFTEKKPNHSDLLQKYNISKSEYSIFKDRTEFDKYDWIIDGIFGIGLSRNIDRRYKKIIEELNHNKNIISIDVPSGQFADNNKSKNYIKSKYVITFGNPKLCHFLIPVNNLFCIDIGFKSISAEFARIEYSDISNILKPFVKKQYAHKYSKGEVSIHAGSYKYPGAAILSAKSAYAAGSSYVTLVFPSNDFLDVDNDKYNKMICSLKSQYPDIIIEKEERGIFGSRLKKCNNFLYGPGIVGSSLRDKTQIKEIEKYLKNLSITKSIVIDSGGFNFISEIDSYHTNAILTPHIGELKTIFKLKDDILIDINLFKSIQGKIKEKIIILKSFNTFIITKDIVYIMDKGPSLLATAGTGDVLSGILVSLLSQGYSRLEASIIGTYLHAEAANYYMNHISKDGIIASKLINCIPFALNKLRKND